MIGVEAGNRAVENVEPLGQHAEPAGQAFPLSLQSGALAECFAETRIGTRPKPAPCQICKLRVCCRVR